MNSREKILSAIQQVRLDDAELPSLEHSWIEYDDPPQQFLSNLELVGGSGCVCPRSQISDRLRDVETFTSANQICSLVSEVSGNVDLNAIDDPHELKSVDFVVAEGHFAVAENGAIWFTDEHLKHRVLPFLTQHLALIVPVDQVINNMHEAYRRLSFAGRQFGVFISGPSKTADIEQSLVIGAHGARSLTVLLTH